MPPAGPSHIPYARFQAALHAQDLAFIQRHSRQLTIGLNDAVEVCRLIAEQQPAQLEEASLHWIWRFAASASEQQRHDYELIVRAFDAFTIQPDLATGQLSALCAARGLDR